MSRKNRHKHHAPAAVGNLAQAARDAVANDTKARADHEANRAALLNAATVDSFNNFAANMGLGADNVSSGASYGFNPITRNRTLLEWIHRGSWVGGVAVDVIADDMTRAGVTITGLKHPSDAEKMKREAVATGVWRGINETISWARLYGGALGVILIDGQDVSTPLKIETVGKGQFKGILSLDRWQVEPRLDDPVTEYGPDMGNPRFYVVNTSAPGLWNKTVHYSRVLRLEGVPLPWQQRLQENLWGISVLERLYDRMVAFDSATTGAAQLVYKAYIRTLKIKGYKEMVGENGPATAGLARYVDMMRRFQSIEGINVIDANDTYETIPPPGFSGLADVIMQFGQQISGALQVPLVRLFGQSPTGLSATGESDMRTYYDGIKQRQEEQLLRPITTIYQLMARSLGIKEEIGIEFNPLWQLTGTEKGELFKNVASGVKELFNDGVIERGTALRELRHSAAGTGIMGSVTDEMIKEADDEGPPVPEAELTQPGPGLPAAPTKPGKEKKDE